MAQDGQHTSPARVHIFVIGAGFGGLAAALKLDEVGEHDFLVVDRGAEVGGTWRDNTYPGAACDVPSQLYAYSFAPNPDWTRAYSTQPEILAYLRRVAAHAGVLDRFVFNTLVEDASWSELEQAWHVRTSSSHYLADIVVSASGALSDPKLPDLEGIETFQGEIFHSAQWNHSYDLRGKRVAVMGTGASAIQIVPEIAPHVAHLDVYQRTAPWVVPRNDRAYSGAKKLAFRHVPAIRRLARSAIYWSREALVPAFTRQPKLAAPARRAALHNISRAISDPDLLAAVTPTYELGCKRILSSNTWYPALVRDNVALVTDRVATVTPHSIVTTDGIEREVDVIIAATGFHATEPAIAAHVRGQRGVSLAEHFEQHGMQAYKGTTVNGFPNLFLIVGPDTGLGHSSMIFMIESQVNYLVEALAHMRRTGIAALEPKAEVQRAYVDDLRRRLRRAVWSTGGCQSWYLDRHGRNTTLWPRPSFVFRRQTARFDAANYDVAAATIGATP